MIEDLKICVSDRYMSGLDIFEVRIKTQGGHGAMTVTHVRAADIVQAAAIMRRYCENVHARYVGVFPFCVADPSVLDDVSTPETK
jgi:hypothetical protein